MPPAYIVVIGAAGEMAGVGIKRLAGGGPVTLDLLDLEVERVELLARGLPAGTAQGRRLDLFDEAGLRKGIRGADLVINGAGPYLRTAPLVMRACIDEAVPYLDFDDDVESTQEAFTLDAEARKAGIPLFKGCGASPGLTNVMATQATAAMDSVDRIDICWVSGDEGAHAYGAAVLEHAIHMSSGTCLTWRDGAAVSVPAFVDSEIFPMGGAIGDHRLYEVAHPEVVTLPRHFPEARAIRSMGGLHPQPANGVLRGISHAVESGEISVADAVEWMQAVFSDESGSLTGWRHALRGMFAQVRRGESSLSALLGFLWRGVRKQHLPYSGALLVRATGTCNTGRVTHTIRTSSGGPDSVMGSSMAATTGTCVAAFATLALTSTHSGTLAPEDWVDPAAFRQALDRLGVPGDELDLIAQPVEAT